MTQPLDESPPAVVDDLPPRPVWATKMPEQTWCPGEWVEVLETLVPGWDAASRLRAEQPEASSAALSGVTTWQVIAAARRGRLHAHRGEHREDAFAMRALPDGGWCGAVADGAGSATWSRVGSAVATHTFCDVFASASGTPAERAARAATTVFEVLRALAERVAVEPRTLRTTLLCAALVGDVIITMQVGDGGIVLVGRDGNMTSPQAGDAGEFSGDVMHFLPDDGTGERLAASLHETSVHVTRALVLATDGIEDPWYPLPKHARSIVATLEDGVSDEIAARIAAESSVQLGWRGDVCKAANAPEALAEWMAFEKRGENDDRSLLFARIRDDA